MATPSYYNRLTLDEKIKRLLEDGIDFEKKVIYLWGELEENLGTVLRTKYSALSTFWEIEKKVLLEDFVLDISSYGGSIYSIFGALDFFDEIKKESGVLVNTKAQGSCMSAATFLLCGGTGTRMATKRCKLMLHDIQTDGISGTATQVKHHVKALEKEQTELFTMYAQYSRAKNTKPYTGAKLLEKIEEWKEQFANKSLDHYISAEEALKLKLIDKIV